ATGRRPWGRSLPEPWLGPSASTSSTPNRAPHGRRLGASGDPWHPGVGNCSSPFARPRPAVRAHRHGSCAPRHHPPRAAGTEAPEPTHRRRQAFPKGSRCPGRLELRHLLGAILLLAPPEPTRVAVTLVRCVGLRVAIREELVHPS